jgi:hypothetical protein
VRGCAAATESGICHDTPPDPIVAGGDVRRCRRLTRVHPSSLRPSSRAIPPPLSISKRVTPPLSSRANPPASTR